MLNLYKIIPLTEVEGPNKRFCLWVQGCKKLCVGCLAKETWKFGVGTDYSVEKLTELITNQKEIEGVTFLGGEPFEQAEPLSRFAQNVKKLGLSVVCFTGYTIEELRAKNSQAVNKLLENIDLLVDGGFEKDNFDLSRPWVGSSNQRYIFLTDFYSTEEIKKYKNKVEVRISEGGKLEINGMGDFERIKKDFCLQLGRNNVK